MTRTLDGVQYERGRKFRVVAEGVTMRGLVTAGRSAWSGWSAPLAVGDVVECLGFGPGWGSDPGYGVHWTSDTAREAGASHVEIHPGVGGIFDYRPKPGILEPMEDAPC